VSHKGSASPYMREGDIDAYCRTKRLAGVYCTVLDDRSRGPPVLGSMRRSSFTGGIGNRLQDTAVGAVERIEDGRSVGM